MNKAVFALILSVVVNAHAQSVQIRVREVGAHDVQRLVATKQYGIAREVAIQCADKNADPNCQLHAGELLLHGLGGPSDEAKAAKYITLSAEQGSPAAQALLGNLHFKGIGVAQDRATALHWWTKSAANCNLWAQNAVARTYFDGEHVQKDLSLALHWVSVAAHFGFAGAKDGESVVREQASASQRAEADEKTRRFLQQSGCGANKPVVTHEP